MGIYPSHSLNMEVYNPPTRRSSCTIDQLVSRVLKISVFCLEIFSLQLNLTKPVFETSVMMIVVSYTLSFNS